MVEKIQLKSFGKKQTQKRKKGVYLQNIPLNLTRSLHHISSTHFLVYASVSFRLLSQSLQTLKRKWASWATAADIVVGSISKSIHHHIVMFHLRKNNFLHKQLLQNFCPNIQYCSKQGVDILHTILIEQSYCCCRRRDDKQVSNISCQKLSSDL